MRPPKNIKIGTKVKIVERTPRSQIQKQQVGKIYVVEELDECGSDCIFLFKIITEEEYPVWVQAGEYNIYNPISYKFLLPRYKEVT